MKKFFLIYFITLLIVDAKDKALFVEGPWPPYIIGEFTQAPQAGIAVDILKEIFADNYELHMKLHPWKRSLELVKSGISDGLMLTLEMENRKEFFVFSDTLLRDRILICQKKDTEKINFNSLDDLIGLKIGVILGAGYSNEFQRKVKAKILNVEAVSNLQININKLLSNKLDIILLSEVAAQQIFQINPDLSDKVQFLDKALLVQEFKIAISKKSYLSQKKHLSYINKRIKELKMAGRIDQIVEKYK